MQRQEKRPLPALENQVPGLTGLRLGIFMSENYNLTSKTSRSSYQALFSSLCGRFQGANTFLNREGFSPS